MLRFDYRTWLENWLEAAYGKVEEPNEEPLKPISATPPQVDLTAPDLSYLKLNW